MLFCCSEFYVFTGESSAQLSGMRAQYEEVKEKLTAATSQLETVSANYQAQMVDNAQLAR